MRYVVILVLAIALVEVAGAVDGILTVRNGPDVHIFRPKPFDGTGHTDGIAEVDFRGVVVEEVDGTNVPLSGVKFSVEPDKSFAHFRNRQIIFLSNTNGRFLARLYVGAAMTVGGKTPGRVYQTRRSKLCIEKDGYETVFLWFDYEMPNLMIVMKRKEDQQAN